jgi:exodeoxyribonuclease III
VRIVSWNVTRLGAAIARIRETIERLGADVLLLQEVGIRADDAATVAALESAVPEFVCHWSLNRDAKNVAFRGGRYSGVVTYVRADLGRVRAEVPSWDLEGRFVVTHLPGLAIGNVYAVNGTDRPYFDHEVGSVAGDRHAFKRRFQRRVLERARELRAHGSVVVGGDWNVSQTKLDTYPRLRVEEPHARARAELAEQLATSGMVDAFRRFHPEAREYTWFNTRAARFGRLDAARVDFILVSEELVPRVKEASILADPADRPGSDHAPIVVEFRVTPAG